MGVCGWTICVTCNKYILHANCNSLTGIKGGQMNKSTNWSQPENAIPATRNLPPSRTPVLAAAQQQADKTIAHSQHPLKIHTHPHPHFTIHNTRSRQRQLLPVCLPLWLQLLVPVPRPQRTAADRSPNTLPIAVKFQSHSLPLSQPIPSGQSTLRLSLTLWDCGFCPQPTDRSRQTGTHLIPMSRDRGEKQGRGGGYHMTDDSEHAWLGSWRG